MPKFSVCIPPHVKAGQTIRIRCPDGTEGDVKVPKGLKPGDNFIFEMPMEAFGGKKKSSSPSSSALSSSSGAADNKRQQSQQQQQLHSSTSSSMLPVATRKGFLDREIVSLSDFVMALGVGLLIGISIVFGFLLGVLWVTTPEYEEEEDEYYDYEQDYHHEDMEFET